MTKELLFSVTASDCDWSYTRGTGAGGQKKNKTNSAVHCTHRESGAHGYAEDTRSQDQNRKLAFTRMAKTDIFKSWHKLETMRRNGQLLQIENEVAKQMRNIRVEIKQEGKWTEVHKDKELDGRQTQIDQSSTGQS